MRKEKTKTMKHLNCDQTKKNKIVTTLQNSNCDKTQKLKF